jgi:hypothetical protein
MFCQPAVNATFSPTADLIFQEISIVARLETIDSGAAVDPSLLGR